MHGAVSTSSKLIRVQEEAWHALKVSSAVHDMTMGEYLTHLFRFVHAYNAMHVESGWEEGQCHPPCVYPPLCHCQCKTCRTLAQTWKGQA